MVPFPADAAHHQLIFAPCQENATPRPLCPPTNPPSPTRPPSCRSRFGEGGCGEGGCGEGGCGEGGCGFRRRRAYGNASAFTAEVSGCLNPYLSGLIRGLN